MGVTDNRQSKDARSSRDAEFMRLFLRHERRIYGLIFSLVPDWADADDLMQEVSTVIWRKFHEFEPGTNFSAWALKIARFQVLAYRKKQRVNRARLSDVTVEQIADRFCARTPESVDARRQALKRCIDKLNEQDRQLIQLKYNPGSSTESVAEAVGRSVHAVYKALNRVHGQLLDCITSSLRLERG
jgi:RNA polymerase sigma-70 factor (ECF subfamily)